MFTPLWMGYFILYPFPPVKDLRLNKIAFSPEDFQNVLVYPPDKKKVCLHPLKNMGLPP